MKAQNLKNSILQLAIQGKLVEQRENEGTAKELLDRIKSKKEEFIKDGKIKIEKAHPEISDDEIPFDIPENWDWVRCSDVFNIRSASRIHKTDWKTTGIPFLRGRELVQLSRKDCFDAKIFIAEELYEQFKKKTGIPMKDDLLISAVGTIGKVYVVKETDKFYYKDAYILCFENHGNLFAKYIRYMLESVFLQYQIKKDAMATTVAQLTISKAKSLIIPIPPLEEQKRIAAKIEELMPYVDKYGIAYSEVEQLNKKFPDDMQKSILQYAIQGKLVEQREEDGTAENLYKQIQDEKKKLIKAGTIRKTKALPEITEDEIPFDIPVNWKWVRLEQVCEYVQRGKSPKYSDVKKYPVVSQKCNQWTGFSLEKAKFIDPNTIASYTQERILQNGDLMWNSTGLGTLGRVAIYEVSKNPYELAVSDSHVTVIRLLKQYFNSKYFYYYIANPTVQSIIEKQSSGSTKQIELATNTIKNYLVPLPPVNEQKRIVAKIEELLPYTKQLVRE